MIIKELARRAKEAMPQATVYEALPESIGPLPAITFWPGEGQVNWPRAHTYTITHNIEVRLLFSRVDQPRSDAEARAWIERMRVALDADPRLGGVAEEAGVVSYRYGVVEYANVAYLGITLTVRAIERVMFPVPAETPLQRAVVGGAASGEVVT